MKNIKQKLRDLCWYKICYADLLKNKDKEKYANIMADEILELFEKEKQEMAVNISSLRQWLNEDRITDPKKMVTNEQILTWLNKT